MLHDMRAVFGAKKQIYESVLISFKGTGDADVFNLSTPFLNKGKVEVFGCFEKRSDFGNCYSRRFVQTATDEFTMMDEEIPYQIEDPFVAQVDQEILLGGVRVIKNCNKVHNYFCDFYRGALDHLSYYTTGPDRVRGVRVVQLESGELGVFSTAPVTDSATVAAPICFLKIRKLEELTSINVAASKPIDGAAVFCDTRGYVHQVYLLSTGLVGCIAHHEFTDIGEDGHHVAAECATSFVYDPNTNKALDFAIIATRDCFPACAAKTPRVAYTVFPSGLMAREDGKFDFYCGLGDTSEGRIVIDDPFSGHGSIVSMVSF